MLKQLKQHLVSLTLLDLIRLDIKLLILHRAMPSLMRSLFTVRHIGPLQILHFLDRATASVRLALDHLLAAPCIQLAHCFQGLVRPRGTAK